MYETGVIGICEARNSYSSARCCKRRTIGEHDPGAPVDASGNFSWTIFPSNDNISSYRADASLKVDATLIGISGALCITRRSV